jgi:hypothetical protein
MDFLMHRQTPSVHAAIAARSCGRVRKRIFEMVKAVGTASHAEVLGRKRG